LTTSSRRTIHEDRAALRAQSRGETLSLEIALKLRQEKSAPVMAAFKKWIDELIPAVPVRIRVK
jgi:hypothetical protein